MSFNFSEVKYGWTITNLYEMQGQQVVVNTQNQINSSNKGLALGSQVILKMNDSLPVSSVGKLKVNIMQ